VLASEYEKYFSVGADLTMLGAIDRDAADAADQVAAFCRSDSVTGQVLNIDGGVFFH